MTVGPRKKGGSGGGEREEKVRRRRGGEDEGSFIDGWQMGRAVKAAWDGTKPERGSRVK